MTEENNPLVNQMRKNMEVAYNQIQVNIEEASNLMKQHVEMASNLMKQNIEMIAVSMKYLSSQEHSFERSDRYSDWTDKK
jgi:hypothetical protein